MTYPMEFFNPKQSDSSYDFDPSTLENNFKQQLKTLADLSHSVGYKDAFQSPIAMAHINELEFIATQLFKRLSSQFKPEDQQQKTELLIKSNNILKKYDSDFKYKPDFFSTIAINTKEKNYDSLITIEDLLKRIKKCFPRENKDEISTVLREIRAIINVVYNQQNQSDQAIFQACREVEELEVKATSNCCSIL